MLKENESQDILQCTKRIDEDKRHPSISDSVQYEAYDLFDPLRLEEME